MDIITAIAEPLALGLSTGTWCAMYCAPVLLPFLFGRENLTHRRNLSLVGLFLAGRLAAYIALGFALGLSGLLVMEFFDPVLARSVSYVAYILCGLVLLANGFAPRLLGRFGCASGTASGASTAGGNRNKISRCEAPSFRSRVIALSGNDSTTALLSGLCVGLHICPPFWTAALRSANSHSPVLGALYFILFYAGTLPFFLPLLGIPLLPKRFAFFRKVARMAQVLVGGYFLVFAGLIPFAFRR